MKKMLKRSKGNMQKEVVDTNMVQGSVNKPKLNTSYRKQKFSPNRNFSKSFKSGLHTGKTNTGTQEAFKKSASAGSIVHIDNELRNANVKDSVAIPRKALLKDKYNSPVVYKRDESLMTLLEPDSTLAVKKKADVIQSHLQFLFKDKNLCDLIIKNNEKEYKIHSFALTMHSDRYKAIFTDTTAKPPTEISITCARGETVEKVLEYMYTFSIKLDEDCIESVLDLSEQLGMKMLTTKCAEFLMRFDKQNVLKYIMICKKHNFRGLLAKYVEFARQNFKEISALPEFLNLKFDDVKTIIMYDERSSWIRDNLSIFCSVCEWAKADALSRNALLPRLLEKVWFDQIEPKKLEEVISSRQFILEIPECLHILRKAFRYHAMTMDTGSQTHPSHFPAENQRPKWRDKLAPGIYVIGGLVDQQNPYNQGNKVLHYSLQIDGPGIKSEAWTEMETLPSRRCGHCAVILDTQLYVIGGSIHEDGALLPVPTKTVLRYNPVLQMWDAPASMTHARSEFAACVARGLIFVFGGETDAYCPTDVVEYYCPLKNLWSTACPMPVGRTSHAACLHGDGNVIIIGGCIDNIVLDFVDIYNVNENRWHPWRSFPDKICRGSLLYVKGRMFYMGGAIFRDEVILTSSDGVYEHDGSSDMWKLVEKLKFPRHLSATASLGNTIYFIGGFSTFTWTTTAQVTAFQITTYHFDNTIPDLPYPLMNFAAVAYE